MFVQTLLSYNDHDSLADNQPHNHNTPNASLNYPNSTMVLDRMGLRPHRNCSQCHLVDILLDEDGFFVDDAQN